MEGRTEGGEERKKEGRREGQRKKRTNEEQLEMWMSAAAMYTQYSLTRCFLPPAATTQ